MIYRARSERFEKTLVSVRGARSFVRRLSPSGFSAFSYDRATSARFSRRVDADGLTDSDDVLMKRLGSDTFARTTFTPFTRRRPLASGRAYETRVPSITHTGTLACNTSAISRSASDPSSKNRAILIIFRLFSSFFFVPPRARACVSTVALFMILTFAPVGGRLTTLFIYIYIYICFPYSIPKTPRARRMQIVLYGRVLTVRFFTESVFILLRYYHDRTRGNRRFYSSACVFRFRNIASSSSSSSSIVFSSRTFEAAAFYRAVFTTTRVLVFTSCGHLSRVLAHKNTTNGVRTRLWCFSVVFVCCC